MSMMLEPDSKVPALDVPLVGGGRFSLGDEKPEMFTQIIFYRGKHCPVCANYLKKLDGLVGRFKDAGVETVAVSMDPEDRATDSVKEWGLQNVRVGYGVDEQTARAWGLYVSEGINEAENRVFNEPGIFWVRPDGRLFLADVSNMPWGRPDLEFLLSKIDLIKEKNYPARGTKQAA